MSIPGYQKSYSILGVFQDDDWETVRNAYKRQIRRWHPDRFQEPDKRRIAEDKCKEINIAYKVLDDYYQQHGVLPPGSTPDLHSTAAAENPQSANEARSGPGAENSTGTEYFTGTQEHRDISAGSRQSARRGYAGIAFTIAAVASGYMLLEPHLTGVPGDVEFGYAEPVDTEPAAIVFDNRQAGSTSIPETDRSVVGSTDVHAAWKSGGTTQEPGDPDARGRLPYIARGSTKQDVLAIQGRPLRATDTAWEYGLSRINFQDGIVTDWYENPMNPLIVQR